MELSDREVYMYCAKVLFEFRGYKNIKTEGIFLKSDEAVCVYLPETNTKKEHKDIIKKTRPGQRIIIIHRKAPKRFMSVDNYTIETLCCDQMIVPLGENEVFSPFLRVYKFSESELEQYNKFENIYIDECCGYIYDSDPVAIWNDLKIGDIF
jgi:hypothetical protein